MADPIVFDCGGSTRIKRILATAFGDMPKLLDVGDLSTVLKGTGPLPPGATGSQELVKPGNAPFTNVTIMFQDSQGIPFTIPVGLPNPLPKSFVIASNLGQNVRVDFVPPNLIITIFSTVSDPLVAAKQLRLDGTKDGRRRYVVENAGPIKTITLNDTPPPVFDATNLPAGAAAGLPLYVSVVIT
jgi:hypothetical protein